MFPAYSGSTRASGNRDTDSTASITATCRSPLLIEPIHHRPHVHRSQPGRHVLGRGLPHVQRVEQHQRVLPTTLLVLTPPHQGRNLSFPKRVTPESPQVSGLLVTRWSQTLT